MHRNRLNASKHPDPGMKQTTNTTDQDFPSLLSAEAGCYVCNYICGVGLQGTGICTSSDNHKPWRQLLRRQCGVFCSPPFRVGLLEFK